MIMKHTCHAIWCDVRTRPTLFMCLKHWKMVPLELQRRIWRSYRTGQCGDRKVSMEYFKVTREAKNLVRDKERELGNTDHWPEHAPR